MGPEKVQEKEKEIIGKWPNTYTFTKSLTEKVLQKRCAHLKIVIIRPSIVISSANEPFLGWTENISAMGGLIFAIMLGLINYLQCQQGLIIDSVPVDTVSNLILAATAYTATKGIPGKVLVMHSTSSNSHPSSVKMICETVLEYLKYNQSIK